MEKIFSVGKINRLKLSHKEPQGWYLTCKSGEEVLLPGMYALNTWEEGEEVDVFLYHDSEDRLVAITQIPYAFVDEFAYLEVVDVASFGAFLDIGLPKHLFVPKKFQKSPFKIGQRRIVKIIIDQQTNRLIGAEKFGKFLSKKSYFKKGDEVKIFILAKTPLGFKVIINNKHEAMLFSSDIFENIAIADEKRAFIKNIRQDGKIDVSLRPFGENALIDEAKKSILHQFRANNYALAYNYKTDAKIIKSVFNTSKKAYKKALSSLLEEGAISMDEFGMKLIVKKS